MLNPKRTKKPKKYRRKCSVCGEPFIGNSPQAKYCNKCTGAHAEIKKEFAVSYWAEKGNERNKIGRKLVRILRNKGYSHGEMVAICEHIKSK